MQRLLWPKKDPTKKTTKKVKKHTESYSECVYIGAFFVCVENVGKMWFGIESLFHYFLLFSFLTISFREIA